MRRWEPPLPQDDPTLFANGHFAIDLDALRDELRTKGGRYRCIVDYILRAHSAWSINQDLKRCLAVIGTIERNILSAPTSDEFSEAEWGNVIAATTMGAVVLYTRALQTSVAKKSPGRVPLNIIDKMPKELRPKHGEIMDLRSGALVHFGVGNNHRSGIWNDEVFVFYGAPGLIPQASVLFKTISVSKVLITDLKELLAWAIPATYEDADARNQILCGEMAKLYLNDKFFREAALRNGFEPDQFMDERALAKWKEALQSGHGAWEIGGIKFEGQSKS